jgi:hypothetical protein
MLGRFSAPHLLITDSGSNNISAAIIALEKVANYLETVVEKAFGRRSPHFGDDQR